MTPLENHEKTTFRAFLETKGPRDPPWMQERQILFRIALTRALYDQTAPQLCLFYVPGLVIEKSRSRAHTRAQENRSRISARMSDFSPMLELLCKFSSYCYLQAPPLPPAPAPNKNTRGCQLGHPEGPKWSLGIAGVVLRGPNGSQLGPGRDSPDPGRV